MPVEAFVLARTRTRGGDVHPLVDVGPQLDIAGLGAASHTRVALQTAVDVLLQKLLEITYA